ncbi:MAG: hypothetical protein NUV75_00180, partial [Gallionella sp.]|nr:hypothetical protein [Gallionella sp.]
VPNPGNPGSLNRYSYVLNNPIKYTDPTGHRVSDGCEYEGCDLRNGLPSSSTYFVPRVGYTMYPQTVEPLVSPVVQQAASELLAAIDPRNLPELRYDENGNFDADATLSTVSVFPALHACALTIQGACAVSINASGYGAGVGVRGSGDVWVTSAGDILVTATGGGGTYLDIKLAGGGFDGGVIVIPGANDRSVPGAAVQVGGSAAVISGVGAELVIIPTETGALLGYSASYATGKVSTEVHLTMTGTRVLYYGHYQSNY